MAEADPNMAPSDNFRVVDPLKIPVGRYYENSFFKEEKDKLWSSAWQMACRLEQIPNVGDFIEYEIFEKSVIVVRTKDGVKAYHNVCRHRGVRLADGHGNCKTQGFICPFHGWRWNMDGENTFVYGRHMFDEKQLEQADLALAPCRAETAIGCVFVNFDPDAAPLRDMIGPLLDSLEAHGAERLRAEWCYATELPANWKVAMEAFMEGYHVMRTHPQLQRAVPMLYNTMYGMDTGGLGPPIDPKMTIRQNIEAQIKHLGLLSDGMAGMVHQKEVEIARQLAEVDLPEDPQQAVMMWFGIVQDQIYKQLSAKGEPLPDLNAVAQTHPLNAVEYVFPNYFLLPFFSSMSAYRIRPTGPETCMFEIWSLTFFPEGEEPDPVMEPTVLPYDSQDYPEIPRQDYSNIPEQQLGLHNGGFEYMRLSGVIEGLISNYQRIIDGYLDGVDSARLAGAIHQLAGNFDGDIKQFEF